MEGRYLFQSWVRASEGGTDGAWTGMEAVRWFEAEGGVRRSKMRRWESEETEERMEGEWGEKEAE